MTGTATMTARGATASPAAPAMKWEKVGDREWQAVGKSGTFTIKQCGRRFWASYSSPMKSFRMPPNSTLSGAKTMCEDNGYWEE